jgi:hypothetical protein
MPKSNGAILWQGASLIDGAPIVAIAVGLNAASMNRKTGAMLQTYILRSDVDPVSAVRTGADVSICGNCRHRGTPKALPAAVHDALADGAHEGRTCYVNIGNGPFAVYRTFKRKGYPRVSSASGRVPALPAIEALGEGRLVRLGTYGDPAAVPSEVWTALARRAAGHTGYTHQWRTADALRALCMASVDNEAEAAIARGMGWRTFRVALSERPQPMAKESLCPASAEAGKKLTCSRCLACAGANGFRGSIYIPAHGNFAVMHNVKAAAALAGDLK